jgi:predicted nucleic acid-binding protein
MKKILLDTDASIKLTKISIIETFASNFQVILTSEVYAEQVTAGLKRNFQDAKKMEKLISEGKVTVVELNENASKYDDFRLGYGEKSVINYFLANDIDLIVSDDETFIKILDRYEIPFTPVAGVILISVINGLITREKGISYLELLKPMIKNEHMFYIRSKIEGLK